jgi:hypothetical protein
MTKLVSVLAFVVVDRVDDGEQVSIFFVTVG